MQNTISLSKEQIFLQNTNNKYSKKQTEAFY